jgi:Xaa-Pro aminopeptidase
MDAGLSATFFSGNREKLRSLFSGTASIVITANGLMQKSSDTAYPFRQDSNFWYLTGIDEPNMILVMDKTREYLIMPKRSAIQDYFDGAINADAVSRTSGVADVLTADEGWKRLKSRLKRASSVATLAAAPAYIESSGLYVNPARASLIEKLKVANGTLDLLDLRQHLARMRMVKQPEEIESIQNAINITLRSLKKVHTKLMDGKYTNEFEIELDLTKHFNGSGGQGHSFTPIIAAGEKSCTIHPQGNDGAINDKPILLDVGAQFNNYAADISRTWSAKPNKRFNQVHSAVQEASDYAMSVLKPGVILKDYEKLVEHFVGEKLRELGMIKTIESSEIRKFFPHATSHFLGIDVHDAGDYEKPLEPGVVITVEPGIYINGEGFGVRIENDVLISEDGAQNLSGLLP